MDDKDMKDGIAAEMNHPTNVNFTSEAMREMEEHLKQKEMERLMQEKSIKREIDDMMMAEMNGFYYPTEEEEISHKRK